MNEPKLPRETAARLARQAREQFVAKVQASVPVIAQAARSKLAELCESSVGSREMHERRDAMMDFDKKGGDWAQGTVKAWYKAVVPPTATARIRLDSLNLELIGDEVVERKIIASRLALAIQEKIAMEFNELRVRMEFLEGEDLPNTDVLRPEALCQLLVEQWGASGLTKEGWALVQDIVRKGLVENVPDALRLSNQFLIDNNVLRDIDLATRVKRASSAPQQQRRPAESGGGETQPGGLESGPGGTSGYSGGGDYGGQGGGSGYGGQGGQGGHSGQGGGQGGQPGQGGQGHTGGQGGYGGGGPGGPGGGPGGYAGGGGAGGPAGHGGGSAGGYGGGGGGGGYPGGAGGRAGPGGQGGTASQGGYGGPGGRGGPAGPGGYSGPGEVGGHPAGRGGVADETRLMTSSPPLARARARASGVLGQLKRLLTERVVGYDGPAPTRPSPALAEALSQQHAYVTQAHSTQMAGGAATAHEIVVYDDAAVQEVAVDLRRRTGELKKKASTSSEKATIEIVALMFQSILSEERIPPAIRVWFARLQMPVLRVALAEPEFFGSLEHPARQLIDRMGSCVMGFNAASIGGSTLEVEIKRVVQVIEQYPETGRRVFQLVYDEFQKFLARFLTEDAPTQKLVSVAQQVEQKETAAIQYTIEMRSMLAELPIRDEIREFLFKVWAEVLAVSAVKNGPQHAETLELKKSASDLVWAASAKPNRAERAKVIADLPRLLQRMRQGMTLIGIQGKAQEAHIKTIGDTLADAFLSKTKSIPQEQIDAMAKRLANLEDFVANDPATDLPLDRENIEMMLGIDASMLEVIADGGSRPSAAMMAWATELQVGNWFALDHNGATTQVQYAWRSERKQLHLFAAPGGRSYLMQLRRLGAYLQAGLLLPAEEEALTVRATRDALA
ncbi:MAG TPA: DUF1631 family protein, partial [Ramlibacter sp.]|nr:DUF1631 family protein [Ramlibacter sp.]